MVFRDAGWSVVGALLSWSSTTPTDPDTARVPQAVSALLPNQNCMLYNLFMPPRPSDRQPRAERTRGALVTAAERLWIGRSLGEVCVAQVATAAGAHPNQVTYYFGSKESLFVEVAFRSLIRSAVGLEQVPQSAATPEQFVEDVTAAAVRLPELVQVTEALLIVRRRPELSRTVQYGLDVLLRQSEQFLSGVLETRGWVCAAPLDTEVRGFWCGVLGAALLQAGDPGGPVAQPLLSFRTEG